MIPRDERANSIGAPLRRRDPNIRPSAMGGLILDVSNGRDRLSLKVGEKGRAIETPWSRASTGRERQGPEPEFGSFADLVDRRLGENDSQAPHSVSGPLKAQELSAVEFLKIGSKRLSLSASLAVSWALGGGGLFLGSSDREFLRQKIRHQRTSGQRFSPPSFLASLRGSIAWCLGARSWGTRDGGKLAGQPQSIPLKDLDHSFTGPVGGPCPPGAVF